MNTTPFTKWLVLASMSALVACSSGSSDVGSTSLNVVVPNGDGTVDIQTVRYTIDCQGNSDTFLDNNDSFADEVTIQGELEVVDGRTSGGVPTEIWQAFMDLPPGPCIVQLEAFDDDGERICVAQEPFTVAADSTTKIALVLICDVSFQAPVGMADVDATFSFVVGNFCPDLFVLNALDSAPVDIEVLPGVFVAGTEVQVRGRDGDSTCGNNCDPQTCDNTVVPPTCAPGPDPGVSITVSTDSGAFDCDQNLTLDGTSCVLTGDQLTTGNMNFACDASMPGATATITAVITDGDLDCDESKQITIQCPGLNFCDVAVAGDNLTDCDDGNDCTADSCDRTAEACVNANEALGTACTPGGGGPGECDGAGACVSTGCFADGDCDDGNVCTTNTCDLGTNVCNAPTNNDGVACASGSGSGDGTCGGGTCNSNDACLVDADCPDPGTADDCSVALCDTGVTPFACGAQNAASGTACDAGGGPGSGACDGAGVCSAPPVIAAGSGSTTWVSNTNPPGSLGGPTATADGCSVFVTALNTTIFLQVDITLDATSDGANNIATGWTINATHFLLPTLSAAAELGAIAISAVLTNATGGPIPSSLDPAVVGSIIGAFVTGTTLSVSSPAEIVPGAAAVVPTVGAGGTVSVNWDGIFALDLLLGGAPLVVVDQTVCNIDVIGADIDFSVL